MTFEPSVLGLVLLAAFLHAVWNTIVKTGRDGLLMFALIKIPTMVVGVAVLIVSGLLMISRFPYPHLVVRMLRGGHSFPFLASIVVMALVVAIEHEFGVLLGILIYVLSGLLLGVFRLVTTRRLEAVAEVEEIDDRFEPPRSHLN